MIRECRNSESSAGSRPDRRWTRELENDNTRNFLGFQSDASFSGQKFFLFLGEKRKNRTRSSLFSPTINTAINTQLGGLSPSQDNLSKDVSTRV